MTVKPPIEKEWRQFEEMVARLEAILRPEGYIVLSPDKLVDRDTGQRREVDCSIRRSQTNEVISVECRKRGKKQDVLWIEQLVCKRASIGLTGTIAVSSEGFSKAARLKAEKHGIVLKTYREVDRALLDQVLQIRHLIPRGTALTLGYETKDEFPASTEEVQERLLASVANHGENAVIYKDVSAGRVVRLGQVIRHCLSQLRDVVIEPGLSKKFSFRWEFAPGSATVEDAGVTVGLIALTITLRVEVMEEALESARLLQYSDRQGIQIEVAAVRAKTTRGPMRLEIMFRRSET